MWRCRIPLRHSALRSILWVGVVAALLAACATRTPTVVIADGTLQQELVSKSQKIEDFADLTVPFVLASDPQSPAHVDMQFRILTRGL